MTYQEQLDAAKNHLGQGDDTNFKTCVIACLELLKPTGMQANKGEECPTEENTRPNSEFSASNQ